jgi:hypothetical protein
MFHAQFFGMMFGMPDAAPPGWLFDAGARVAPLLTEHAAVANALFACLQLAIGVGLLVPRTARLALAASVPWALAVWLFGEAAGGIFVVGATMLTGAPGAALLYAAVAVLLWPRHDDDRLSVAESGPLGRVAPLTWPALWLGTALLQAESLNRTPDYAGQAVMNAGLDGPGWLHSLQAGAGSLLVGRGLVFCVCAGILQAVIGVGILRPTVRRWALVAGVALAGVYWVLGQNLGGVLGSGGWSGILTSGTTDPGTGPVVLLLALALWPRRPAMTVTAATIAPSSSGHRWRHRRAPVLQPSPTVS